MNKRSTIWLVLLVLCGFSFELYAAGTPAGTVIQTRSRAIFTSRGGTAVDTAFSAIVTITVAQKGAINITPSSNATVTQSDSTTVDYALSVINSGNAVDGVTLSSRSPNGFGIQIYRDANSDGILQSGERSLGTITQVNSIPVDAPIPLIIRVRIPRGEHLDGIADSLQFIARSKFDTSVSNYGTYITTVHTAGIDPVNPGLAVNNITPIAGAQIEYTFTITNSGSVAAHNVSIVHNVPSGLSLLSGSASTGSVTSSSNSMQWNIGSLEPSQSVTVTFKVIVSTNIAAGTVIPAAVGMYYSVGFNNYTVTSNPVAITVSGIKKYGVELSPFSTAQVKDAADTVWYRFNVRNSGTIDDILELSAVSSKNLPWALYRDGNNNGSWNPSDPKLTNTNDSGGVDLDSVAVGDSVRIFAMVSMPVFTSDMMNDSLTVTVVSAAEHNIAESRTVVSTIRSPLVSINTTILPAGNQPAGSVITYKISYENKGSVPVSQFSLIDTTPKETQYVRNSVKVNGLAVSDNAGGVSIAADESNNTVITVSIGTLAAKTSGSIEYKVKIK